MGTKQLVYASHQVFDFDGLALVSLLYKARQRNERLGITGVLLYCNGVFVQCLEGTAAHVDAVYGKICADSRHRDIVLLQAIETDQRHFQSWMMGCAKISEFHALQITRAKWDVEADRMNASDECSPGFMLVKSIWEAYKDYGFFEVEEA